MLTFPLHNAALDLKGKPPEELPHGQLAIPEEVREVVEMRRGDFRPEVFAASRIAMLNHETVGWYFENLGHEVIYRVTPEGPVVLTVGRDEVPAFRKATPPEEQRKLEGYLGY
jgi:hypothetical protein